MFILMFIVLTTFEVIIQNKIKTATLENVELVLQILNRSVFAAEIYFAKFNKLSWKSETDVLLC